MAAAATAAAIAKNRSTTIPALRALCLGAASAVGGEAEARDDRDAARRGGSVAARALSGSWQDRRWFAVGGEDAREAQGHPRVGGLVTVDGAPGVAVGLHDLSHFQQLGAAPSRQVMKVWRRRRSIKDLFP